MRKTITVLSATLIKSRVAAWSKAFQMRNDIAHCGHRSNAQRAASLIRNASKVYDDLCQKANEIL